VRGTALEIGTNPLSLADIVARLNTAFAGELEELKPQEPDTVTGRCAAAKLKAVAARLRDQGEVGYGSLNLIAGVDYVTHMETVYHLYSWQTNTYLELHVVLPANDAQVDTVCDVWPSAEWLEREAWDMFGIRFLEHPDLRRILLRDDFVGHPLRKDYVDSRENHPHV